MENKKKVFKEKEHTVFLSYCSKDESVVDIIDNALNNQLGKRIKISRYTRDVGYKDSFKEFMNSIGKHDYILSIVSDSYLKSSACMYEVGEVLKNHDFTEKLLFIVLNEEDRKYYPENYRGRVKADIYDPVKKLEYIIYWQEQYEKLRNHIDRIKEKEATREANNDLAAIKKIMDFDIAPFMKYLSDTNGMTFSGLKSTNFNQIINFIIPGYNNSFFNGCDTYEKLFEEGIKQIYKITKTDYNQIILYSKIDSYSSGLVVVVDIISEYKQRYRKVEMNGIIALAYRMGKTMNISDVGECKEKYFCAVGQTKSELVVPIKVEGNSVGVINVESERVNYFTEEKIFQLELIASLFGMALSKIGCEEIDESNIPYMPFTIRVKKKD